MHKPIALIAEELSPATVDTLGSDVEILSCSRADRRLKVIGRAGAGLDNVDVAAASRAGVMMANAPTSTMALLDDGAAAIDGARAWGLERTG